MAELWFCVHPDCDEILDDGLILCTPHYRTLPRELVRLTTEPWDEWASRVRRHCGLSPLPPRNRTSIDNLGHGIGKRRNRRPVSRNSY